MRTRTWPYGTRLSATVMNEFYAGGIDIVTLIDEHGEGHQLFDCGPKNRPVVDTKVTLVFTQGGPTGGYWQIAEAEVTL